MNKKFSIVKTIDPNKLEDEIDKYIMQTGETNPYLFMCIDTINAIVKEFLPESFTRLNYQGCQSAVGYWTGYKMFIDNDLKFGEVEIR